MRSVLYSSRFDAWMHGTAVGRIDPAHEATVMKCKAEMNGRSSRE